MNRQTKNQILLRLSDSDYSAISPLLTRVDVHLRKEILVPGEVIQRVYFPESGLFSLMAVAPGSEPIECGMIGLEGASDQVFKADDTSPLLCICQMAGSALVLDAADYLAWIAGRPAAAQLMARFQQSLIVQLSFTALSHGSFTINERLARWLLMSFDRSQGEDLPLVHEFIAAMLAVRRAGVTDAVHVLEGHGAIKSKRGLISLRDRATLEELAGTSYGIPEAEYLRLMGPI